MNLRLDTLTKGVLALFGLLYVIGIVITQLHLGQYNLADFDLVQSRYVFTGGAFVISFLPIVSFVSLVELIFFRGEPLVPPRYIWLGVFAWPLALYALAVAFTLSVGNFPIVVPLEEYFRDLRLTVTDTAGLFLMPWLVDSVLRIAKWLAQKTLRPDHPWIGSILVWRFRKSILMIPLIFVAITIHAFSYNTWLHEDLKVAYGGGAPRFACVKTRAGETKTLGIVHETSSHYYFLPPSALAGPRWWGASPKLKENLETFCQSDIDLDSVFFYEVGLYSISKSEIIYFFQDIANPND